jgi:hypothetical protein
MKTETEKNSKKEERAARVYVTQVPMRRDHGTGALVPAFNINTASEHGEVVVMLPSQAAFSIAPNDLIKELTRHLEEYDPDRDFILPLGDFIIISAAFGFLGRTFGRWNLLTWDRQLGRYLTTKINFT